MPSGERMKWILAVLLICFGCASQGQINWRRQQIAPPADSLGSASDCYILGVSNNVIWRMFPVSLLATNVTASLEFPYTAITNAPWYISGDVASLASGSTATNFTVYNGLKLGGLVGAGDGNIVVLDGTTKQFQIGSVGIGIASDAIYGNGSGLTNLAQATNALRVTPVESYNYRTVDMTVQTNVYDDIVFEASAVNPVGIVDAATLVDTSGQSADQLALVFAANRLMLVAAQMPHTWNEGTTVYPHLHFEVQSANAVTNVWKIDYSIADIDGTFPASTHVTNQITFAAGSQWKHFLMNVPTNGISMTGKHKSAIIRLRYTLLSTTESMHLVSFDVHYRYGGTPVIYNP